MVKCFRIARKLARTAPLGCLIGEKVYPGPVANSDAENRKDLAKGVSTLQHPCTTASYWECLAIQIEGVPVVNASILQEIRLINLNPNVIMMAEKQAA